MRPATAARSVICQKGGGWTSKDERESMRDREDIVCVMIDNHNKTSAQKDSRHMR